MNAYSAKNSRMEYGKNIQQMQERNSTEAIHSFTHAECCLFFVLQQTAGILIVEWRTREMVIELLLN
jgi:hypothetical protein